MNKQQADELRRLIADAGKAVWDEATLNVNTRSSWQCNKALHNYIDSLTQDAQPCAASHVCDCQEAEMPCARAELTDAEIEEELEKVHARFSMYSADVKNIHAARAVIAADRAKRSKQ